MSGRNIFRDVAHKSFKDLSEQFSRGSNCVFISHRQADVQTAREIADFLGNTVKVDYYLDEDDTLL